MLARCRVAMRQVLLLCFIHLCLPVTSLCSTKFQRFCTVFILVTGQLGLYSGWLHAVPLQLKDWTFLGQGARQLCAMPSSGAGCHHLPTRKPQHQRPALINCCNNPPPPHTRKIFLGGAGCTYQQDIGAQSRVV